MLWDSAAGVRLAQQSDEEVTEETGRRRSPVVRASQVTALCLTRQLAGRGYQAGGRAGAAEQRCGWRASAPRAPQG